MISEIGENLKIEKCELQELGDSTFRLKTSAAQFKEVKISEIEKIELAGVKNNSGFGGSMEWGMSNPTFLLPTNFLYNIISLFKRKNDIYFYKILLDDGKQYMVSSKKYHYNKLLKIFRAHKH